MPATPLFRNRIRQFWPPVAGYGHLPPDVERLLWFLLGAGTAFVLTALMGR